MNKCEKVSEEIIKILSKEKCTVEEAIDYILPWTKKKIVQTSTVQIEKNILKVNDNGSVSHIRD